MYIQYVYDYNTYNYNNKYKFEITKITKRPTRKSSYKLHSS